MKTSMTFSVTLYYILSFCVFVISFKNINNHQYHYKSSHWTTTFNYEIKKAPEVSWESKPVRNFWKPNETQAHNTVIETRMVKVC